MPCTQSLFQINCCNSITLRDETVVQGSGLQWVMALSQIHVLQELLVLLDIAGR